MAEPVSLEEARAHLRVLHDDEDGLIEGLIIAAREWVENFTGKILVRREVTQRFDRFDPLAFLHAWPIAPDAVLTVTYVDASGVGRTVTDARLILNNGWAQFAPAFGSRWPVTYATAGAVSVTVEAGYATPDDVPQSLKQAMLLLIGHWFANREAVNIGNISTEIPMAVDSLCRKYRSVLIA